MTCSFGVCQCQGMAQPALARTRSTEGPVVGSPCSTLPVMQGGTLGNTTYVPVAALLTTGLSLGCCAGATAALVRTMAATKDGNRTPLRQAAGMWVSFLL